MSRLSDVHKLGTELKHRIVALRDLFHRQMEENNNVRVSRHGCFSLVLSV